MTMGRQLVGTVYVDAGLIWVGDPYKPFGQGVGLAINSGSVWQSTRGMVTVGTRYIVTVE